MPRCLRSAERTWSQTRCRPPSSAAAGPIATLRRAVRYTPKHRGPCTYGPGSSSAQRKCERRGCGGWRSSPGRGRCPTAPTSTSGSSDRSQSISGRKPRVNAIPRHRARLRAFALRAAYLVRRLGLELLEDLERLLLGGEAAHLGRRRLPGRGSGAQDLGCLEYWTAWYRCLAGAESGGGNGVHCY